MIGERIQFGTGVVLLIGTLTLAGCGSSGNSPANGFGNPAAAGTPASSDQQGKHSITVAECRSIIAVSDDLSNLATGGGINYVKDQAVADKLADTVDFPDSVSDSYKTWRWAVDQIAAAFQKAGVKPNDDPLPDQISKIQSALQLNSSQTAAGDKAGATITTWIGNDCD